MPRTALTNLHLEKYAKAVPFFKGVYMRTELPKTSAPSENESGIINLDVKRGPGTHWVGYKKRGNTVLYYDSFGDLRPPKEVVNYFRGCQIFYNFEREQEYDTNICGHLVLNFLYKKHRFR